MTPKDSISALDFLMAAENEREVRWANLLETACAEAGVEFVGIQKPLFPEVQYQLCFQRGKTPYHIPVDSAAVTLKLIDIVQAIREMIQEEIPVKTQTTVSSTTEPLYPVGQGQSQPLDIPNTSGLMTWGDAPVSRAGLLKKMHSIYSEIDSIAKNGYNDSQRYPYTQAADVVNTVRAALIKVGVYAEINFQFAGNTIQIERKNGPAMSAERVRCNIVFHDLDSAATITSSGLGVGADSGDKGVFKAETGALKKALLAAALIPEMDKKQADPEGDTSVDEPMSYEELSYQEPAPRPADLRRVELIPAPETPARNNRYIDEAPKVQATSAPVVAPPTMTSAVPTTAPVADGAMPDEKQMESYRAKFKTLGDDLAVNGGLKASKGLPINTKLKVYMLSTQGVNDPKDMNIGQWENFFAGVNALVTSNAKGYAALAELINIANGTADVR